jgi:murein DD-endopeptidase MepM/ murein hydrolase activator NlpD
MHKLLIYLLLSGFLAAAAQAEVQLDGELAQGGLLFGQAPAGSRVELNQQALMVSEQGHFLLGFGRDETGTHNLVVHLPDGRRWEKTLQPREREFDIQRIDGLPDTQVTPPPEALKRIRDEAALTRRARELRDQRTDWLSGWIWPVTGRISGVYGSQRILNGQPRNPHWGLDIAAPTGTPVRAPAGGFVSLTHPDMYFSGGTIFIDHGHGLVSAFLHLSDILVEEGQHVSQGELIGKVGATGRATGPHLDWRINLGNTRVDPYLLLPPMDAQ